MFLCISLRTYLGSQLEWNALIPLAFGEVIYPDYGGETP